MDPHNTSDDSCQTLAVPETVCELHFSDGETREVREIGFTARGEIMLADFDAEGHILSIELIGRGKPCQRG